VHITDQTTKSSNPVPNYNPAPTDFQVDKLPSGFSRGAANRKCCGHAGYMILKFSVFSGLSEQHCCY